jgi:hypothetical protein
MAYENLIGNKTINGMPADQGLLNKVLTNQDFFKTEVDQDEDLLALDRNLVPVNDDEVLVGELLKRIKEVNSILLRAEKLELGDGSELNPSLKFLSEDSGAFLSSPGYITFRTLGVSPLSLSGAGVRITAGNTTQILIENTQIGNEGTWSVGSDITGLSIGSISDGYLPKLKVLEDRVEIGETLSIKDGEVGDLGFNFTESLTTGFYRDSILNSINFAVNGSELLRVNAQEVELLTGQLICPQGDQTTLGILFAGSGITGLYGTPNNELKFRVDNEDVLVLNSTVSASVHIPKTISMNRGDVASPLTDGEVDVSGFSKMFMSTIDGNISIRSFINGTEGQFLYIIKADTENTLTIKHDDALASIKILLKSGADFILGPGYGGLVLSYDVGSWREISRS